MTHKEFYFWLEGYLYGRLEDEHIPITPIVEKMNEVKDESKFGIAEPYRVPIPVNPFPKIDPFNPPYEIYCGTNKQDDDSSHPTKTVI